jgi:crotonobetainyl-CoA:carnitine CoA-transferase CaiB-like acyl-CoA transferase
MPRRSSRETFADSSRSEMPYDLLAGVRVVELSMYAFAPSASAVLADWGAEVIKVVPPGTADPMKGNPIARLPDKDVGVSFMWEILNRGKRCVGIDVSTEGGRDVLLELVAKSDVFITNLLPGARRRFHIDSDDLFAVNKRLVYGRATGHGDIGSEREQGGFDITDYWARSGIGHAASQVSDEFVPLLGPSFGDIASGTFLAGGLAAALFRRERTGQGAVVDVSLLGSGMWMLSPGVVASQLYDIDNIPRFRHAESPNAMVAVYSTRDERLIFLAGIQTEGHFENFCQTIGRPELLDDPRFATARARHKNAAECITVLDGIFAERDLAEWRSLLTQLSTPWTVIQTAAEAATDPQAIANHIVIDVDGPNGTFPLVASPVQFDGIAPAVTPAPDHGEHTEEVLLELGHSWDDVLRLKEAGAVL